MNLSKLFKGGYLRIVLLAVFLVLMATGIYFREYLYMLNYGSMICLSCIGIG